MFEDELQLFSFELSILYFCNLGQTSIIVKTLKFSSRAFVYINCQIFNLEKVIAVCFSSSNVGLSSSLAAFHNNIRQSIHLV